MLTMLVFFLLSSFCTVHSCEVKTCPIVAETSVLVKVWIGWPIEEKAKVISDCLIETVFLELITFRYLQRMSSMATLLRALTDKKAAAATAGDGQIGASFSKEVTKEQVQAFCKSCPEYDCNFGIGLLNGGQWQGQRLGLPDVSSWNAKTGQTIHEVKFKVEGILQQEKFADLSEEVVADKTAVRMIGAMTDAQKAVSLASQRWTLAVEHSTQESYFERIFPPIPWHVDPHAQEVWFQQLKLEHETKGWQKLKYPTVNLLEREQEHQDAKAGVCTPRASSQANAEHEERMLELRNKAELEKNKHEMEIMQLKLQLAQLEATKGIREPKESPYRKKQMLAAEHTNTGMPTVPGFPMEDGSAIPIFEDGQDG